MIRDKLLNYSVEVDEDEAERLQRLGSHLHTTEVHPPSHGNVPDVLNQFVKAIYEPQTKWLGLKNASPVAAFEIRRPTPEQLRFQFAVPTKRLERKVRNHLKNQVPGVSFSDGVSGLPVTDDSTVSGGLLTTGRNDWYPLETDFDDPPNNAVISGLHRHAMTDTGVVLQLLFQPAVGKPLQSWWWTRRAYKRIGYLRKEKQKLWGSRSPTPREKQQAKAVESKAGSARFHVSIRVCMTNADPNIRSRLKEIAGGFNVYENPESGQYLNTVTVKSYRQKSLHRFAEAVAARRFAGWSRSFQASQQELAALLSIPDKQQHNLDPSDS